MKRIYSLFIVFGLLFSACDSYFDVELYQNIPNESAYASVSDVENALNGAYYALGQYRFQGRNLVGLGDLASDNGLAGAESGHMVSINAYTVNENDGDLADIWTYGYQVVDRATRVRNGAKALIEKGGLSESNIATLNAVMSQCYALRAYASFMLVNVFGLPYGTNDDPHGGIVLVKELPIEATETVSRATVKATYEYIVADITAAETTPNDGYNEFYFNPAAIQALKARVNLYMKNYGVAAIAAQAAIDLRDATPVSNTAYVDMWKDIVITGEDIFTIPKTSDDNLSANSLNTLYGTYKSQMTADLVALLAPTDIRSKLLDKTHPKKYDGIPGAAAVSNISVFRVSEMYLIMAEAKALTNDLPGAQTALFFTAKRNSVITSTTDLPGDKDGLISFIAKERRREFFAEGQRWYDARRTGEVINAYDGKYKNYDVSKFVYPIPAAEINAAFGTEQNDWKGTLPN